MTTISGAPAAVNITSVDNCGGTAYVAPVSAENLIFRSGLHIEQSGASNHYFIDSEYRLKETSDWLCDDSVYDKLTDGNLPTGIFLGVGLEMAYSVDQNQEALCSGVLQTTLSFDDTDSGCGSTTVKGVETVQAGCGIKFVATGPDCVADADSKTKSVKIVVDPDCDKDGNFANTPIRVMTSLCVLDRCATDCTGEGLGQVDGAIQRLAFGSTELSFSSCGLLYKTEVKPVEEVMGGASCTVTPP